MFNYEYYDENVEYCEYVFYICNKYELNMNYDDIQRIANEYIFELDDLYKSDEVVEDENILLGVIRKYIINKEASRESHAEDEVRTDLIVANEKKAFSSGGNAYFEFNNDPSYEDIIYKLKQKPRDF